VATSYRDLGPTQQLTARLDQTGRNPGNWTIEATQSDFGVYVAQAEIYQISIDGPIGSSFTVYRGTRRWNQVAQGWANSYDPVNPLYVRPADSVFLFWNVGPGNNPTPTATFWLRYDSELPENKGLG
jgi:hypothetical protein